jgi:hypothetical protein
MALVVDGTEYPVDGLGVKGNRNGGLAMAKQLSSAKKKRAGWMKVPAHHATEC